MGVNQFSRNASIIGGKGNDTLRTLATKTYMDGGDDADLFIPLNSTSNTTMIGGAGKDIYRFDPYYLYGPYSNAVVITDISSEDIIRYDYDASNGEELSITELNGNIILKDEDFGNFKITLKGGASKKSEIANVAYRSVNWSGTLGELFPEFFSDTDTTSGGGTDTSSGGGGGTNTQPGGNVGVTVSNSTANTLIGGTSYFDSIVNYGNNVTVYGEGGGDRIINYGKNVYIDGGAGNDTIVSVESLASNLTIDANDGDDWIQDNANTKNNFFYGGKGNDTINSHSENTYVDGGAGNDYISSAANYNTIIGGLSKDTIILARPNANVDSGDDDDIIEHLYFFRDYATSASINGGKGNDSINMFGTYHTIKGGAGNDTISFDDNNRKNLIVYNSGDGSDIITGISSNHTLKITGAEYTTTKSGSDLVISVGSGKISVKGGANVSFTIDGTLDGGEEDTVIFNNAKESLATAATITADYAESEFDATDYGKLKTINASEVSADLTIYGNKLANKIIAGEGNDCIFGGKGNDTFTGGGGEDTFVYIYGDGNKIITDYTEGEDKIEIQNADVENVINSASIKGNDVIFKIGTGKITVKGGKDQEILFTDEDGNEYKYPTVGPAETIIFNNDNHALATAATITADYEEGEFDAADYDKLKTINASEVSADLTIYGNKNANKIIAGDGNDCIFGGKGNDTFTGNGGEDTFVYIYGDGNKIITDYTEGEDKIEIQNADVENVINSASIKGNDIIFKIGSGKITVKGGKDQEILFTDEDGNEYTYPTVGPAETIIFNNDNHALATAATITADFEEGEFDAADYDKLKTIDASEVSADLTIYGNKIANKIIAGEGNDYIYGGKGADTFTGNGGEDTFVYIYGDGNKIITDYTEGEDKIEIQNADVENVINSASIKGNDVIFKVGTGKITVKGGADIEINIVDDSGNEESYSNASPLELFEDNNFITDGTNLDSITEQKFSVTEIQSADYSTFAQDKNILVYSNEK